MIKIAILGRPNVGKSSFFNRLAKERDAITSDLAGTTRDTKKRTVTILDREAEVVDTGGLDDQEGMFAKVKEHSLRAALESDIVLYMVDGKSLPEDADRKIFYDLQELGKPIALLINKIDNDKEKERAWEFGEFGPEKMFEISVSHNRGINPLLNWLHSFLPHEEADIPMEEDDKGGLEEWLESQDQEPEETNEIRIGIIGRVNVGKSSVLNALLGEERSVVSDVAGTTIDPVDDVLPYEDKLFRFVDTAGIRRRGKIEGIEKYALGRTEKILEETDIALLILDSSTELVELDEKIAGLVDRFKLGCIIVLNKWDIAREDYKKIEKEVRFKFKFLDHAPIMTLSAMSGRNIDKLKQMILDIYANFSIRIPTSQLNDTIKEATIRHQIPSVKGREVKILYATQYDSKPPRIALMMNRPELHFSYRRYLINYLREKYGFVGTPIIFSVRGRGEKPTEG